MAAVLPLRVIHRKPKWVTDESGGTDKKLRNGNEFSIVDPRAHGVQQFDIVSYQWGDKAQEWRCDGDIPETGWKGIPGVEWKVKVRPQKLNDILRLMDREEIAYLWADCVCLNQEDDVEKAAEIARMCEYYKSANRCHILLDADEVWDPQGIVDDLKLLDHVLHHMVGAARATDSMLSPTVVRQLSDWAARPWYFPMSQREVMAAAVEPGILNCYATCISHVRAVFRNLYFSRVWTFQEMLLGKYITMWGVNPLDMRCIGALDTWLDLAIEAADKAVKLRDWIIRCRAFTTRGVDAIWQLIVEDLLWLTFLRVQVQGLNSARTDIISGGPHWWYDNYKGICNVFAAISIWPRECERRQDIFQGLLGVFSGLFTQDEIEKQLSGEQIEPIAFAFFKQLSLKTGRAWTRLAISSGERTSWGWIPVAAEPKRITTTDVFAGVVTLGLLRPNARVKTLAITGLVGSPRPYIKFMPRQEEENWGFNFIFKGCNRGKKVKASTLNWETIPDTNHMRNVVGDETGRILVQCTTVLGSLLDPIGHVVGYRQRLLGEMQPLWHVTDPNAKPAGWIDRCVSGTFWENPDPRQIRPHNHSMSYHLQDFYDCQSRLYNDTTKDISCEVRVDCGCVVIAPFYYVLEAIIAVQGSFLGETSVDLDKDSKRIILQDGAGLVQAGDVGKGFHIVAFGGDVKAHKSYAVRCRKTRKDDPVVPRRPWPCGRAVVRDDFKHAGTDVLKDYGYIQTGGSGNLLICRNNPVDDYRIVGVCVDEHIENKKGEKRVVIR